MRSFVIVKTAFGSTYVPSIGGPGERLRIGDLQTSPVTLVSMLPA